MIRPVILDSGPLGRIAHPRPNREIAEWFSGLLTSGAVVLLSEIADYEVRRNLLLEDLTTSVERLDQLKQTYMPLMTQVMLRAAALWAIGRKQGQPTADPKALDADVILAAQAEQAGAVVATENIGHLSRFVDARNWREVS